jgi:Sulfotransferase family
LTRPFFILGAPRSGTSLLSRMLDSHPAIAVPDETKIFNTFLPLLPAYGDLCEPSRLRRLVTDIVAWRWIRRLPGPPEVDAVLARVARPDLGAVFAAVIDCWAMGQGKARWGEKTPSNLYFWAEIAPSFPQAAIVHILRDGRDVAISQIQAPFGPKTIPAAAERWVYFVAGVRALREQVGEDRFVEIRYEDLLASPRETMATVLGLIGEPFDSAVLEFHRRQRPVGTDPVNDRNIQRPLQVANSGKWAGAIGPRELEIFESIAGPMLDACGYPRATDARPMSGIERAAHAIVAQPLRRTTAMLGNRAGMAESLERQLLHWRLRSSRPASSGSPSGSAAEVGRR